MKIERAWPIILVEDPAGSDPRGRRFGGKSAHLGPVLMVQVVGHDERTVVESVTIAGEEQIMGRIRAEVLLEAQLGGSALYDTIRKGGELAVVVSGKVDRVGALVVES